MDLVTIRTFDNYFNANIVLTRLQDAGIECYLKDEFTVTIDPLLTNAIGGIKLVIKDTDINDVSKMLEEMDTIYRDAAVCPDCGHKGLDQISKPGTKNFVTAFFTWMFSSYAVAPEKIYQCPKCGWEGKQLPAIKEFIEE
ncbi:MAG: hypothetical protein ABJA78_01800 [Ferruginibacter sp.]